MAEQNAHLESVPEAASRDDLSTKRLELVLTSFALVLVVTLGGLVSLVVVRSLESLAPALGAGPDAQRAKRVVLGACTGGAALGFVLWLCFARFYVKPFVRRSEAAFRERQREAREVEVRMRRNGEFVASLGGEMRTPMSGIVGMSELLLATKLDARQRGYAEKVKTSALALLQTLNEGVDLATIEAGTLELVVTDCDARRTAEQVVTRLAPQAHAKGLELALRVGERVPEFVRCDGARLRQILTNVASYAIKSTERGEVVVRLDFRTDGERRPHLGFTVDDTSPGIPKQTQARLFELPQRGKRTEERKPDPTGVRLALAGELVRLMEGSIGVASSKAAGSHFWFDVPVGPSARVSPPDATLRFPQRALIVDDNLSNLAILREQLAAWGMQVKCATRGDDALDLVQFAIRKDIPFELVLIDHRMPQMSGAELARKLRIELGLRALPIVLLASAGSDELEEARYYVDEVVKKPVQRGELLRALEHSLDLYRTRPSRQVKKGRALNSMTPLPAAAKRRVLVAGDDSTQKPPLAELLARSGCAVERVASGTAVLEALTRSEYALVLIDTQACALDAYETVRRIRAGGGARTSLPVIAVTAHAAAGERAKAILAGMDDCIVTPVSAETLDAVLANWLERGQVAS